VTAVAASAASVIAGLVLFALAIRSAERGAGLPGASVRWIPVLQQIRVWLSRFSLDQWRAIDAETEREPGEAGGTSLQVLAVLVTVAVSLTLQEYFGGHDTYERLFPPDGSRYWELRGYAWWSGWRVFGYVIIPMVVLACLPGQRIRDYHVSPRGFFKHLWIYALLFGLVLPAVLYASTTHAFRQTYPFYRLANRSYADLVMWEALYGMQFLSLEFFFRGFILHGLRRALGANALFVMLVPYCMIHYGKPLPETLGAIGAGLILGTLAMRTRSIWGGVLIHVGVATTMDVLALRGCPPVGSASCH
jgi:membrane protease YdiL (CAAX protease family)